MRRRGQPIFAGILGGVIASLVSAFALSQEAPKAKDAIRAGEQARIEMIQRISPSVVAVFDEQQRGGGSGVLIDADGFGVTNFHVIAPMLGSRRGWGGLGDGKLYELQVLGIDPTGDLAMFRLARNEPLAFSTLGDSDEVKLGDTAYALGNPFSLSEDYTPTVTMGIVTGVHRYQWGTAGNLSYTDCIQVDASINPGNSGGPLFNEAGEVIGINGRISVNTRGRFNVGFGYAVSSNQIKRFVPALRAGMLARHGTLPRIREGGTDVVFTQVSPQSSFYKDGLRSGDRLIAFDEMPIENRNQYASVLGAYPSDWPVVLDVERGGQSQRFVLRLEAVNPRMDKGFVKLGEQNQDEVRRVLSLFAAAAGVKSGRAPTSWHWKMTREFEADANGDCRPSSHYVGDLKGGGPAQLTKLDEHSAPSAKIEYDADGARQTLVGGSGDHDKLALDLPESEQLAFAAIYRAQTQLFRLVREGLPSGQTDISHVGTDALWPLEIHSGAASPVIGKRGSPVCRPVLSVIQWKFSDTATAWYGFDAASGRLAQIRVRDIPTGEEVVMQLSDYRDIEGMSWPCAVSVRAPGGNYHETYSDWKIEF